MPLLETLIDTITNDQITSVMHTPINNQAEHIQEEHVTLPMNTTRISAGISQPNASGVLIPPSTHKAEFQCRLNEMEDLIRRIPGMLAPIKKRSINSHANFSFIENIALVEIS